MSGNLGPERSAIEVLTGGTGLPDKGAAFFASNPPSLATNFKVYNVVTDYNLKDDGTDQSGKLQTAVNAVAGVGALFFPYTPNGFLIRAGAHTGTSQSDPSVGVYLPPKSSLWGAGQGSLLYSDVAGGASGWFCMFQNSGWLASGVGSTQSDFEFHNLRFRRVATLTGAEGSFDGAISLQNVSKALVEECIFEGGMTGVGMEGCGDWEIRGCRAYSSGDSSYRIQSNNNSSTAPFVWPEKAIVTDCWSINAGYQLDGVTAVSGAVGSAFIAAQNSIRFTNCGAINPQFNAIEVGKDNFARLPFGITVDGFKAIADLSGRVANFLVSNCQKIAIHNFVSECHNGGTAGLYLNSADSTVESYITVDGCDYYDDYTAAGANHAAISTGIGPSQIVIRNCSVVGGSIQTGAGGGTLSNAIFENCEVRLAPRYGWHLAGTSTVLVRNCRAYDCGNDTTQAADYNRAGFFIEGSGVTLDHCVSLETRVGGARTQTYGFGTNGTGITVNWNDNFTDGNNLNGAYSTTGTVTLASRAITGLVAQQVAESFRQAGDTNDRHQITQEGDHLWGPGNAALDVWMRRNAVSAMRWGNLALDHGFSWDFVNQIVFGLSSPTGVQAGNGETWTFGGPVKFNMTDAASQSSTAPAVASSGTIATASIGVSRVAPTGNVTTVILQAGTIAGQRVTVVNESAFTVTFDVAATSNVADGATSAIPALAARAFVWDSITTRWYRTI